MSHRDTRTDSGLREHLGRDEPRAGGSDRNFGFVFAAACFLFGVLNYYRDHTIWHWWFAAAAIFLVLALVLPSALSVPNRIWTKFGLLLSYVMHPLIMGLLFFFTVTPIGMIMRAAGKDPLRSKLDRSATSYWLPRDPSGPAPNSFKNQF
jgi:energy-coupling factor transporter transmembrane protein EcfT